MTAIHKKTEESLADCLGHNCDRDSHDPMNLALEVEYSYP
jgi:hypothetical protein